MSGSERGGVSRTVAVELQPADRKRSGVVLVEHHGGNGGSGAGAGEKAA